MIASIEGEGAHMPTLTIRNVSQDIVKSLKSLAQQNGKSMEQEVREILEEYVGERSSVLDQIETSWKEQSRHPTADEIEAWIGAGRE
jgi:plasmid stability protein